MNNFTNIQENQIPTEPVSLIAGLPIENRHIYASIDKISMVSSFDFIEKFLPAWEAKHLDVLGRVDGGIAYRHSWKIPDNYFVQAIPFNKTHDLRLEFNPNKVTYNPSLLSLLKHQKNAKLTRIDLAIDLIDNYDLSKYFIECLKKSKTPYYTPHTRHLSGYVFGETSSDVVYRVYDKKLELRKKSKIKVNCDSWWRVEVMIRPKNGIEWWEYSPFEDLNIGLPIFDDCQLSLEDEAVLRLLLDNPNRIDELSNYKRRKFKKLIEMEECLNPIEDHPYYLLKSARKWIDSQLSTLLNLDTEPIPF